MFGWVQDQGLLCGCTQVVAVAPVQPPPVQITRVCGTGFGGGRSKGTQAVFRWWSGSQQPACACALSSPPPPQLTSGPRRVIPWALPLSFASAASLCPWHEGQWLEPLLGLFQYVPVLSLWNMNWSPSWPLGDVSIPLSDPGMWSAWPWDKTTERCQACELEPPPSFLPPRSCCALSWKAHALMSHAAWLLPPLSGPIGGLSGRGTQQDLGGGTWLGTRHHCLGLGMSLPSCLGLLLWRVSRSNGSLPASSSPAGR